MLIAVPIEDDDRVAPLSDAARFLLYETRGDRVVTTTAIRHDNIRRGALVGMLKMLGVDALVAGAVGPGARSLLADNGIALCADVSGAAGDAVLAYLKIRRPDASV